MQACHSREERNLYIYCTLHFVNKYELVFMMHIWLTVKHSIHNTCIKCDNFCAPPWWNSKFSVILVDKNNCKSIRVINLILTTIVTRNDEFRYASSICTVHKWHIFHICYKKYRVHYVRESYNPDSGGIACFPYLLHNILLYYALTFFSSIPSSAHVLIT